MKTILFIVEDIDITNKLKTNFLIEILKEYLNIIAISPKSKGIKKMYEKKGNVFIYRYPQYEAFKLTGYFLEYPLSFLFTFLYFLYFLFTQNFNILHLTIQPSYYFLLILLAKIFKRKIIVDIWDFGDELFKERFGNIKLIKKLLLSSDKILIRNSDLVLCHTKYHRQKIEKVLRIKKNVIEYYGAIDAYSVPQKPSRDIVVLNRSLLKRHDGIIEFLEVVKMFDEKFPSSPVKFIILGYGELYEYAKNFIALHRLEKRITITGFIPDKLEYLKMICDAKVCIGTDVSSAFNEYSLSMKYIEYLWAGKPVISWQTKVLTDYLKDYIYLIKNNDKEAMVDSIYQFTTNPDLSEKYSRLAKKAYETIFSYSAQKNLLVQEFKKLL
ncbi:MAG: glycosyltransferase [Planctomycetota bacterium]